MPVIRIGTSWTRPNGVRYYNGSSWVAPKAIRYYNGRQGDVINWHY